MPLLGELCFLERHVGPLEIGAGILHVLVKEEFVELARKVVVTLDIAARTGRRVELVHPAERVAQAFGGARQPLVELARGSGIEIDDAQEAQHVALHEIELAVHIGFGNGEIGIEHDRTFGMLAVDPHMDRIAAAIAEYMGAAVGDGDLEIAETNKFSDETQQERGHGKRISLLTDSLITRQTAPV